MVTACVSGWLSLDEAVPRPRIPKKFPAATIYLEVFERFGAGTFNDFFHLLPPARVRSYGERLGMDTDRLARHYVFAHSDNGDALSFDIENPAQAVFRFPPRALQPKRLAKNTKELLVQLAKRELNFQAAPLHPYFVPARPRTVKRARLVTGPLAKRNLDAFVSEVTRQGDALLLVKADFGKHSTRTLALPSARTIVQLQRDELPGQACWSVMVNIPRGGALATCRELLSRARSHGFPDLLSALTIRPG